MSQQSGEKNFVILDLNHPKIVGQAIVSEILKTVPKASLDELKEYWGDDYEVFIKFLDKILQWKESE